MVRLLFDFKKWLVCGFLASVAVAVIGLAVNYFASSLYVGAIWKADSLYWRLFGDVVAGYALAFAYMVFRESIRDLKYHAASHKLTRFENGRCFGLVLWTAAAFPGTLMLYFAMNLPLALVLAWMVSGLLRFAIGGMVVQAAYDRLSAPAHQPAWNG